MASCAECNIKMGYTESNVARDHDGMCVACYVKSLVKTKVDVANSSRRPSNVKSLDNYFEKFENILVTSELNTNLRVRKRFGIVHGEATPTGPRLKQVYGSTKVGNWRDFQNSQRLLYHAYQTLKSQSEMSVVVMVGF
jgi:hypothetical protein